MPAVPKNIIIFSWQDVQDTKSCSPCVHICLWEESSIENQSELRTEWVAADGISSNEEVLGYFMIISIITHTLLVQTRSFTIDLCLQTLLWDV